MMRSNAIQKGTLTTNIVKWIISRVKIIICNFTRHFQLNVIWSQRKHYTQYSAAGGLRGAKRQHCMPKNFIRFDKFEQATTTTTTTTAKTVTAEEEKHNRKYKIALRAKVVDETLHHATPCQTQHIIYS